MTTKTFPSGDATAVLLSQELVVQYHLENEVDIILIAEGVLIRSAAGETTAPREQWASLFTKAKEEGRIPAAETDFTENDFDKNEWTWPGL
jgi:hypothetical protein